MIAYGHFNLPRVFVWECMGYHTHSITPKGKEDQDGQWRAGYGSRTVAGNGRQNLYTKTEMFV